MERQRDQVADEISLEMIKDKLNIFIRFWPIGAEKLGNPSPLWTPLPITFSKFIGKL